MSNDSNISNLMKNTLENIKSMIDVDTIVGKSIITDNNTMIIPVSRLTFGFISGGSEYPIKTSTEHNSNFPFGGGASSGVSIKPVAFLIVKNDSIRLLPIDHDTSCDKLIDTVPQIIDMIKDFTKKNDHSKDASHSSSYTNVDI